MDAFIILGAGMCLVAMLGSVKRRGPAFRYVPAEYETGWGGVLLGVAFIALLVRLTMG